MAYTKGHISANWNDSYKSFPYIKQSIKDSEIQEWRSQGYTHDSFSGVMYSQSNKENQMPDWAYDIADALELKNLGFVFYKMCTLEIMPVHADHFETYCRVFNVHSSEVRRAIVFLEDWKSGHYLEFDKDPCTNWKANEGFVISEEVTHLSANAGLENKYTVQISGFYNDNKIHESTRQ